MAIEAQLDPVAPQDNPSVDVRGVSEHVERILDDLSGLADEKARERAEDLVRTLMSFYEAGLERMLDLLHEEYSSTDSAPELIHALASDQIVGGLLALHDIHPKSTLQRVSESLDKVRPYLGSHAGDVELLGIDGSGVLRLRLKGTCDGCPSSTVTVKYAIERAVNEVAPEVTEIEVEGMVDEQAAEVGPDGRNLLPLEAVDSRSELECPVPEQP